LLIEWSNVTTNASGDATWTFALAFTANPFALFGNDANGDTARVVTFGPGSTTSVPVYTTVGGAGVATTAYVLAIGI